MSHSSPPSFPVHRLNTTTPPDNLAWDDFLRTRTTLNTRFHALVTCSVTIASVAHSCVDLFTQFLFPNTPIAHEPTLRASIPLLSVDDTPRSAASTDAVPSLVRRFTLITALCAHILSIVPESLSRQPQAKALSIVFFDASRGMLRAYEGYDLEHPDSTSLTIRMWHSSCAQNTTGKVGASWHYHTEACCLAQRLRLYDEETVTQYPPLERRLLRNNFWHLYLAEKTQVAFQTRPPIIDEKICYGGITLQEGGNEDEITTVPLLDPRRPENGGSLERRILVGFHLRRRISAIAAALIDDVAECGRRTKTADVSSPLSPLSPSTDIIIDPSVSTLVERYLCFAALINDVPSWVMHPDRDTNPLVGNDDVQAYHATSFWAQRSNILTIFHCMRLLILQACIDHGLPVVVGLTSSSLALASRKLDIVRDFLHDVQATPFVVLEAQGETTVDKVRRVGTLLLELLHTSDNATIRQQADTLFKRLLDILSRLDSKACEGLDGDGTWRGLSAADIG
ncbi:hypothetical protein Sste5346_004126 [Sporothrix stenoceras]|uniref:Transcription factor domain-containing protein n=1 Tax=Sporothrix stenoceras TaxID=5173 RepID=A0ABR3ZBI7_9PEZI